MEKKLSALIAVSVFALGLSACTPEQSVLNKPPGKYEQTVNSTDASGTTTSRQSSTEVSVDEFGKKKAVVQTKTTKDPEGLFNKTTTSQTKQRIEE